MTPLEIRVSESAGFCWGVERALEVAREAATEARGPINTLGPLIHNPGRDSRVACRGHRSGLGTRRGLGGYHHPPLSRSAARDKRGAAELRPQRPRRHLPFVKSAQEKAARLREGGYMVVILGEKDHPEVLALRSYAGAESLVVESPGRSASGASRCSCRRGGADHAVAGAACRAGRLPGAAQSGTARVQHHLQRDRAAPERRPCPWRPSVDVVIVVGGRNSGNTRRLAELCSERPAPHLPCRVGRRARARVVRGSRSVGVTAGASTPAEQIDAVVRRIGEIDP